MASNHASLDFFQSLAESSDQIVFSYDLVAHQFSYLNAAFENIWGKTRKSVAENPTLLLKTIHSEDQEYVQKIYHEILEGIIIKDAEFRILLRNKAEKYVCVTPRLLPEQSLIVGYVSDVTAQKEYHDYLKKFSDKKNSVLNILSHDLAGPLGMIHNLSAMLEADTKSDKDQEIHKVIGIIERSSRQGMQLIQDFVKQEFLESTNVEVMKSRVDLVQVMKSSMEEYQLTQRETGKIFHYHSNSEKIYLNLDTNKFMQVINNLISNAIKFTPDGGEITVTLEEKENTVLIKVADNGIGIPEKHHNTLFEKFTRARRPGIKGEPSVGLGMSIIKTIVEWHQAHIWFESQENKGTTFFIELPKT